MKTLKIGFVLDDSLDTPDGVQQYILALGSWLTRQGHEVHYLVGETTRTDITHIHSLSRNVKVTFNGNRMSTPLPKSKRKLRAFLAAEQFDILHVQMPYSPFLAQRIILAASKRTVIVGTFHIMPNSSVEYLANRMLGVALRRSLNRFDACFAVSDAAQEFMLQTFKTKSTILPNVVDRNRFAAAEPRAEFDGKRLTIMYLGRLVPRKGCQTLLEATRILKQKNNLPPFRIVICGKGPLDAALKQFVREELLEDLVTFTGFIAEEDKPSYVASADIMAFPSLSGESFGIVLLEAMASERPVVLAANNSGYHSVLGPNPELLFPPGDQYELAKKLSEFLRDADARSQALAWQKRYVKQFDVTVVGTKLVDTYQQLLQKRSKI
jgi:phosphatidyl-myo-inositol alpha-mannosyltransferase